MRFLTLSSIAILLAGPAEAQTRSVPRNPSVFKRLFGRGHPGPVRQAFKEARFTYSQKESSYAVSVDGDTARFEGIPPDQAVLTCPDGSTYRGSYKALLGCESNYKKLSQMLPGLVVQGSGSDSGGLELTGAGPGGPVTLFYCSR